MIDAERVDIEKYLEIFTGEALAALKEGLETNYYAHASFFLGLREGQPFIEGRHHPIICDTLQAVFDGDIIRLIINMPPSYTKTELAIIQFTSYSFSRVPDCRFLHISGGETLALDNSSKIKEQMTHPLSYRMWGHKLRDDTKSKGLWKNQKGGQFYAVSSGGQIIGFRAGRSLKGFHGAILIDDPQKPEDVLSPVKRIVFPNRYREVIRHRVDNRNTPIIVVMQRLHDEDFSGWLLNGGSGEKWYHLCLSNPID